MKTISTLLLGFTLLGFSTYKYIEMIQPKSIEECVLNTMKGQSDKLLPIAIKFCRKEFPEKL